MATQLTLVNNVLRRLREDTVETIITNDYSILIAMWINDGIRDITDRYQWESLKHRIQIDLVAGTTSYDLSKTVANGGSVDNAGRPTNEHSMLEWDLERNLPLAFLFDDSSDNDSNAQMRLISNEKRIRIFHSDRSADINNPIDFSLSLNAAGDGYDLKVSPLPALTRTVRINFWTPQAELEIDGTDDSTSIILNAAVVEAYVHMIASNERGEEMGEPGNVLERRYTDLLGAALEVPIRQEERENRYESYRD